MHWFRSAPGGGSAGLYGRSRAGCVRQGPRGQEGRTKRVQASKAADPGLQDDDEWGETNKGRGNRDLHDLERGGTRGGISSCPPALLPLPGEAQRLYIMHHCADTSERPMMGPRFPRSSTNAAKTPRPVPVPYDLSIRPRLQGSEQR